jgi:hypothetical protein
VVGTLLWIVALYALYVVPWCGVLARAGKRWWVGLVPVLNVLVLLRVIGRPLWWFVLLVVPLVGIAVWAIICLGVAESFGHGLPYTIGLVFLPFVFATLIWLGPGVYTGQVTQGQVAQRMAEGT